MIAGQFIRGSNIQWIGFFAGLIFMYTSAIGQTIVHDSILTQSDSIRNAYRGLSRPTTVMNFYAVENNRLVWSNDDRLTVLGDSIVSIIDHARYYGLLPKNYHQLEVELYQDYSQDPNHLIRLDILLTDAFLSLAKDITQGMTNVSMKVDDDSLHISFLRGIINNGSLLKNLDLLEPNFRGYRNLKRILALKLDTLRQGWAGRTSENWLTDSTRLQKEVEIIDANMERWRWETQSYQGDFVYVNIPSFLLQVVSDNSIVFASPVIVGSPDHPTPTLSSNIDCIVTYPYWTVPRKIATEEYLPIIQNDTTFIGRNNFEVLNRKGKVLKYDSIDWSKFTVDYFPVVLRQREGDENSLGVLKFIFDNPYAVFLHDTNTKSYFKNDYRALSHGCIRVEKSLELAHYLVTGDLTKKSKEITSYIDQKQRHGIELKKPVPVFMRYFTYEVTDTNIQRYQDIYHLDQPLIDVLYE